MRTFLAMMLFLIGLVPTANAIDEGKLVDMTHAFASDTLHWPTAEPFQLDRVAEGRTPQGYWYSSYNYSGSEHVGTHLDAPFHFSEGGWTTEQIPLGKTIGAAVVIGVIGKTDIERDYLLTVNDIYSWEKRYGRLPKDAIVLMYTGWGRYWGDNKRYLGTDEPGNVSELHFPGFSKEAAEFLIKQRSVKAVGIDTPRLDPAPARDHSAAQLFGAANVPIFENVAALEKLPAKGTTEIGRASCRESVEDSEVA